MIQLRESGLVEYSKKFKSISDPNEIFTAIKRFKIDYEQENFIVFYLNNKNNIIESEVLFKGSANSSLVDPRILFRRALNLNSIKLIVAHNHPSGDLTPSPEDIDVFEKLSEVGDIILINILDSIIFNKKEFYSIKNK